MLGDPQNPLSTHVFYFAYDSSDISVADRDAISAHAEFLATHPEISLVIEGHADERGTREYNLALGERRAMTIDRLIKVQGAADSQIQLVSFGEERPVALGHDEQAWSLNRRVELLYSGY
ncbi:MAG: peptidoglycan-associated lipoprotein Pal [Gammaproteobacteria bacterium]|nr:peptidoglycan-associated lipoprotein Pal [Gammaproteobacteria bacterium]